LIDPKEMEAPDFSLKVLLVEDNPGDAAITQAAMQAALASVQVVACASGEAAWTWLEVCRQEELPRLILADVHLPEMNGIDLVKAVKAAEKLQGIPVFLFSALVNPREKELAMKAGAGDFFEKPLDYYDSVDLFSRIFSAL
jgi:CheY-like chemotaxis protein